MALELGRDLSDPAQRAAFWARAEDEFYDSPHFRVMHAYYLMEQKEQARFFAKLAALVKEMPWVKEANINLLRYMEHIDPTGQEVMPDFQAEIRERIRANGWTVAGMHRRKV